MKDYRENFNIDKPVYEPDDIKKVQALYKQYFGHEAEEERVKEIISLYNWNCKDLKKQLENQKITSETTDKNGRRKIFFENHRFVFYTEFADLEDFIKSEKEDFDERVREQESMNEYMKLPWWQRMLGSKRNDPHWQSVSKDFLSSNLYTELCKYWSFGEEQIKQIANWYNDNYLHMSGFDYSEFLDNALIISLCDGICADGGRVFRTANTVFVIVHEKYALRFPLSRILKT